MNNEAIIIASLGSAIVALITACGVCLQRFRTSDCKTPLGEVHLEKAKITEI